MASLTSRRHPAEALVVVAALAFTLSGCTPSTSPPPSSTASPGASPSSAPSPLASSSTPAGSGGVDTPEAAAALVVAQDPRFAGIGPLDPNIIGGCCSWSAVPGADGAWTVTIEIGWGDCPSGCINRHHWIYEVTSAGTVALVSEDGPPVPPGVTGGGVGDLVGIRGVALAGPVCPVVRPGDSTCADRPVAGAMIHVLDSTGTEVAELTTDGAGAFQVALPRGSYRLVADAVEGLMRAPAPVDVEVGSGASEVDLAYDTGIR